jgi:hypothetical protein
MVWHAVHKRRHDCTPAGPFCNAETAENAEFMPKDLCVLSASVVECQSPAGICPAASSTPAMLINLINLINLIMLVIRRAPAPRLRAG